MQDQYQNFLESKIKVAQRNGITADPAELHHSTKPHQRDIILWLLELGAGLCAADTGMGKSHIGIEVMRIVKERLGGKCLIVTELNDVYAKTAAMYLREQEKKADVPQLFDFIDDVA